MENILEESGDAGLPIQIDWGNLKPNDYEILFPYPKVH